MKRKAHIKDIRTGDTQTVTTAWCVHFINTALVFGAECITSAIEKQVLKPH